MTDRRTHRGPHPQDLEAFGDSALDRLREAVSDLSWLLTRDYPAKAALKLVGDRFRLTERQRLGIQRCACSAQHVAGRSARRVADGDAKGRTFWLDGFNVLTSVEAALAGGIVLVGRDGCVRDMASIHGHYKRVAETLPAIRMVGETLARLGVGEAVWYLDRPVSNSGRLAQWIRDVAQDQAWAWSVQLVPNPDPLLAQASAIVATADSAVLDECRCWFNLAREVIREHVPGARIVDLSG